MFRDRYVPKQVGRGQRGVVKDSDTHASEIVTLLNSIVRLIYDVNTIHILYCEGDMLSVPNSLVLTIHSHILLKLKAEQKHELQVHVNLSTMYI